MTVGERLNVALKARGMSQTSLATSAKVAQPYVSQIISGVKDPSERLLESIASVLKIRPEWLIHGEGQMESEPTLEEALARLSADVLADEPDSFRARLVEVLADLSADEWRLLEGIASKCVCCQVPKDCVELEIAYDNFGDSFTWNLEFSE